MQPKYLILALLLLFSIGVVFAADSPTMMPVACPQDAKLCPDGSSVGRIAPDCAFAECPVISDYNGPVCGDVLIPYPPLPGGGVQAPFHAKRTFSSLQTLYDYNLYGYPATLLYDGNCVYSSSPPQPTPTTEPPSTIPQPAPVVETDMCLFSGNTHDTQSCKGVSSTGTVITMCSGVFDCRTTISGMNGSVVVWSSSCGTNNQSKTVLDGQNDQVTFNCENAQNPQTCACTMDYTPVCGTDGKTYGNACGANCAQVPIAYKGECNTQQPTCPPVVMPLCIQGMKLQKSIDTTGCPQVQCVPDVQPQEQTYVSAHWVCSNGREFEEKSPQCLTYSQWKDKAQMMCAQTSPQCAGPAQPLNPTSSVDSNGASATTSSATTTTTSSSTTTVTTAPLSSTNTITGNVAGITVTSQTSSRTIPATNTITTSTTLAASTPTTTSTLIAPMPPRPPVDLNCNQGDVTVVKFEIGSPCNGSTATCPSVNYDDVRKIKDSCYAQQGQVLLQNDSTGCGTYVCVPSTYSDDKNTSTFDLNNMCLSKDQIPQEKYTRCEDAGGHYLVKANENGCVTFSECVTSTSSSDANQSINQTILTDKTKLLSLALKLENLRIQLQTIAAKTTALADYYTSVGDTNAAAKFTSATTLLTTAVTKIDGIKTQIKDNLSTFSEQDARAVMTNITDIIDNVLNEVLLVILG